jgi:uncharacterized protein (DUF2141 family)
MPVLQKHVFDSVEFVQTDGFRQVAPGMYELMGVAPGRYTVRAKNSESGQLEQSADVELDRDGQELNDSRGETLGSLKLSVKIPGEETLPRQYGVALQDSRRRTAAFRQGDPTGKLTFENLPSGKYAINITAGAAIELTAWLSTVTVSIEGVEQKKGKSVAGVMVALVPKDPVAHIELFRRDQSDFDGTFVVQGVIPGSYTIVAVEDAWGLEWLQPSVLARYVQHGKNVTVDEMMHGTFHLPDPVEVQPH